MAGAGQGELLRKMRKIQMVVTVMDVRACLHQLQRQQRLQEQRPNERVDELAVALR